MPTHAIPSPPPLSSENIKKKIGEVTWVNLLVDEINWKQGIPLLNFSGLVKTHKTQMTKMGPIDL